jgi:type I restriction enzyme S subunit
VIKYLRFWFTTIKKQLLDRAVGAALANISLGIVKELEILLPPLATQQKIAAILDKADELRQYNKKLIEKYGALTQSLFLDMFGDPVRNEKGWEISEVINYCNCIVPGRDKPKSFTGQIPWVTTDDLINLGKTFKSKKNIGLNEAEILNVRAKKIPIGSVIMTCVGNLGVISINEVEMIINQQLHAFQCLDELNNVFLMHNLTYQKPYMNKMASSTTVPYMNKTVCNSIPVLVPPIALQNQFAERVQAIETQKQQAQEALEKSEHLFHGLLQQAFKGELN